MNEINTDGWVQYTDNFMIKVSNSYLGSIVERAIALYCDCPWPQVFIGERYPKFSTDEIEDTAMQEFCEIARTCGINCYDDKELLKDAMVLTLRGCTMLQDDYPAIACCQQLGGDSAGSIYGEIDLITGTSDTCGFWEVKTGYNSSSGILQIQRAWVKAVQLGVIGRDTVSKIGVIDTRRNRKWVRNLTELSEEEKDWLLRGYF